FFFFQAEDGIRDRNVTGVQTCALPIWTSSTGSRNFGKRKRNSGRSRSNSASVCDHERPSDAPGSGRRTIAIPIESPDRNPRSGQIGRASCRERVEITVVEVAL